MRCYLNCICHTSTKDRQEGNIVVPGYVLGLWQEFIRNVLVATCYTGNHMVWMRQEHLSKQFNLQCKVCQNHLGQDDRGLFKVITLFHQDTYTSRETLSLILSMKSTYSQPHKLVIVNWDLLPGAWWFAKLYLVYPAFRYREPSMVHQAEIHICLMSWHRLSNQAGKGFPNCKVDRSRIFSIQSVAKKAKKWHR